MGFVVKVQHTVNGKLLGVFYELPDGRRLYLAHRTPRQMHKSGAWCFADSLLRRCRNESVSAVGVILRHGKHGLIWLTGLDDLYGERSFYVFSRESERALPAKWFRISPTTNSQALAKITQIGR